VEYRHKFITSTIRQQDSSAQNSSSYTAGVMTDLPETRCMCSALCYQLCCLVQPRTQMA